MPSSLGARSRSCASSITAGTTATSSIWSSRSRDNDSRGSTDSPPDGNSDHAARSRYGGPCVNSNPRAGRSCAISNRGADVSCSNSPAVAAASTVVAASTDRADGSDDTTAAETSATPAICVRFASAHRHRLRWLRGPGLCGPTLSLPAMPRLRPLRSLLRAANGSPPARPPLRGHSSPNAFVFSSAEQSWDV